MRILAAAILALSLGGGAWAGTLTAPGEERCALRFSGQIEPGDAAALRNLAPPVPEGQEAPTYGRWICLDSAGGSLAEALRMGRILREAGIGTRVVEGGRCLSACALMFMMGAAYDPQLIGNDRVNLSLRYPRRMLHVTADLGFHRPSLKLDTDRAFSGAELERSFEIATEAALELVRLAAEDLLAPDLVEEMFSHRDQDFFRIDTVGKALRWNIMVDGATVPQRIDSVAAFDACNNFVRLEESHAADARPYRAGDVEVLTAPPETRTGPIFWVNGARHGTTAHYCMVGGPRPVSPHFSMCGFYGPRLSKIGAWRCDSAGQRGSLFEMNDGDFSTLMMLPLDTPLTQTAAAARRVEARAAREFAQPRPYGRAAFRRRCMRFDGEVAVTGVQSYVNLRAAPGFDAPVVSRAGPGDILRGPNDGGSIVAITPAARGSACEWLCQRSQTFAQGSQELAALDQCFEANAFWYEVFDPQFRRGFVSGKFLRY